MPSNYTSNYNLNQWAASDKVQRVDFNADNAKIDAALAEKASASVVSGLQTTVNSLNSGKADKSALEALKTTVAQHTAALAKTGNCQVYITSYQANGKNGESTPNTLQFPHKPMAALITGPDGSQGIFVRGARVVPVGSFGVRAGSSAASWNGNTLSTGNVYEVAVVVPASGSGH